MTPANWILLIAVVTSLAGCATGQVERRIDNVPMYGQPEVPRPEALREADQDFIEKAASGFGGSRLAASEAWYAQGDRFLNEQNLDYAMRRFNQAWLLNPESYQPYWGFARVSVQAATFDEATQYFETAIKLCDDDYQKAAVLSDAGIAYSYAGDFALANERLQESVALDPAYGNAWLRWSQSLYRERDYADAWSKLKRARSLGVSPPELFLQDLTRKMREPL